MQQSVQRQQNRRENARVGARYGIDGFTSTILQNPTAPRGAALSVAAPLPLAQPYPQPPSLALGKAQWLEGVAGASCCGTGGCSPSHRHTHTHSLA